MKLSGEKAAKQILGLLESQATGAEIHVLDMGTAVERPSCELCGRIIGFRLERYGRAQLRILMLLASGHLHTATWRFAGAVECYELLRTETHIEDSRIESNSFWGYTLRVR